MTPCHTNKGLAKFERQMDYPSICQNAPFVIRYFPLENPNIMSNRPFIGIYQSMAFTLVELVVTLAVVAILAVLVVPNMRNMILNSRLTTQANDLISDINVARSEAIKRGTNVVMCTSSNGTACTGSGWSSGRLIFEDRPPYNRAPDFPQEQIIRYHEPLDRSITADAATDFPDPVTFNLRGLPVDALGQSFGVRQFELCDVDRNVHGRYLRLSLSGQISKDGGSAPSCP